MKTKHQTSPISGRLKLFLCLLICFLLLPHGKAQNVNVSGAVTGNGTYPDLKSAFTAINGGAQTSANISVNIVGNTTEPSSAILNSGTWTSLSITPIGSSYTVSGNIAGPLLDLNGADFVTINGGNALAFVNTNTGAAMVTTLRFVADATSNTITNCSFYGSATAVALGVITFSTGTGVGNNSNVISNCDIGPAGANLPVNGICSNGLAAFNNINNSVTNCNIFDFYSSSLVSVGILAATNSGNWNISGNRIFQTALRTYTTANTHRGIQLAAGNSYTVSNNTIGYSSSSFSGVYAMTSTVATRFIGIDLAVGTVSASTVQGNTITAITLTTSSNASTSNGIISGINVTAGHVNITGNLIGGTSGTNLITGSPTAAQGMVVGMSSSSTGSIVIQNNYVGGISSTGTAAAISGGAAGMNITGAAALMAITGNTIGNPTADNIRGGTTGLTTANSFVSGIYLSATPANTITIANNIIRNLSSYGTGTGSYVRGIWTAAAQSNLSTYSITSNLVTNLASNSGLATISNGQAGAVAINLAVGNNGVVSNNTVTGVALIGTAATGCYAAGITLANATSSSVFNNRINNITNASTNAVTTAPGIAAGIIIRSGATDVNIRNNMISLGNGSLDNTTFIGIMANLGSSPNPVARIYYNTINIEGVAASGAQPSFGFQRGDFTGTTRTADIDFRNNLVTNTRTGGTGSHFAIGDNYGIASSTQGWITGASNYNVLNANPATIGWWNNPLTFTGWKSASGSDLYSYSGIAVTYVNPAGDLHLNMGVTPTYIESGAQAIAGINTDIDGQVRPGPSAPVNGGGFFPDIGADEIDGKLLNCSSAIGGTISPATGTVCSGQTVAATSQSTSIGYGTSYQWQVGVTPGGPYANVSGGSGAASPSYTSGLLTPGVYYVTLKTTCAGATTLTGVSNEVTLTVNTTPSVTASSTGTAVCSGTNTLSLNGSPGAATVFGWNGPNGFASASANTVIVNPSINASGNYSFTSTVNGCTSAPAVVAMTVNATPTPVTLTPVSASICSVGSTTLSAAGGNVPGGVMSFTPQTNQNTATTYPAPYSVYWGGQKMQFLILASELTAAGLIAGPLTSIQFPVVSKGTNWGASMNSCQNFQVSLGLTSITNIGATFQTGLTVVGSAMNYTPNVGFNTHAFSPTFVWDGVSNLVVETAFSNNITGAQNDAVISYNSPTTFQSTLIYRADGVPFSAIAAATTSNEPSSLVRPDFIIRGQRIGTYTWTPVAGLSSASGSSVNASPGATTIYTAMVANGSCSASASATIDVTPMPTLSIAPPVATICVGDSYTLTVSGATNYTWSTGATGTTAVVTPITNTIITVSTQVPPCPVSMGSSGIVVMPVPSVSVTPTNTTLCALSPASFTAGGASTYSWSFGSSGATATVAPPTNTFYTVVGTDTFGCSSTATVGITTYSLPLITISPASPSLCITTQTNLSASGANTYTWNTGEPYAAITVTALANTVYTVTGTSFDGCISTQTLALTVFSLPGVTVSPASPTVCSKDLLTLTASGASTYTWLPAITNTVALSLTPTISATYTVLGTDANNCTNRTQVNVIVEACTDIENNGELKSMVSLYPNPSNGLITAQFEFEGEKEIVVTNAAGALITQLSTSNHNGTIDLSTKAKGVYFVKVSTKKASANYRIIIQ